MSRPLQVRRAHESVRQPAETGAYSGIFHRTFRVVPTFCAHRLSGIVNQSIFALTAGGRSREMSSLHGSRLRMPTSNGMAVLETLLEPQERFDELCAVARSRFGRGVIDLSCPDPCDGPDDETCRALRLAIDNERELGFQDTECGGRTVTRRLIASRLAQEYGLPFTYRDVVLTAGATAALNIVFRTLFGSADEVVVLTPCWLDYSLYLQNLGIPIHLVGLRDEVHRHLIWSSKEFYSPLLAYARSVTIYSFGEELFLPGQRIGYVGVYVGVSPQMPEREDVRRQLERATRIMGFGTPTTLMQRAVCDLLEHRPPLDLIAARQKATRSRLKAFGYEVCDGDATFFVYVKAPIADDFKFAELLAAQGVLVLPSTFFHERGYFRISVTPHSQSPQEGLPVFQRVLFLI